MNRTTVVTDGSSDRMLLEILGWLVGRLTPDPVEFAWCDPGALASRPRALRDRLDTATALYPCRLLFVHRDAEAEPSQVRRDEIARANETLLPHVCVVPVRMTEAWLLFDEDAIRRAAGRPRGRERITLPSRPKVEQLADLKSVLHELLRTASGARGRRAKRFRAGRAVHRLEELIDDWSPLRSLSAFQQLESDTREALVTLGLHVHESHRS